MLKTYFELSDDQKEQARAMRPNDFDDWLYQTVGVNIGFACK